MTRWSTWLVAALVAATPSVARAACPASFQDVLKGTEASLVAYEEGRFEDFVRESDRVFADVACMHALLEPGEVTGLHLLVALEAWLRGQPERATAALQAIRRLEPAFDLRLAATVTDADLLALADSLGVPEPPQTRALPIVPWSTWRVDGTDNAKDVPVGTPVLLQLVDTRDGTVRTWYQPRGGVPDNLRDREARPLQTQGLLAPEEPAVEPAPEPEATAPAPSSPTSSRAAPYLLAGGAFRYASEPSGTQGIPESSGLGAELAVGLNLGEGTLSASFEAGYAQLRSGDDQVQTDWDEAGFAATEQFAGDVQHWGRLAALGCAGPSDLAFCLGAEVRAGSWVIANPDYTPATGERAAWGKQPALGAGGLLRLGWWPRLLAVPTQPGLSVSLGAFADNGGLVHAWASAAVSLSLSGARR